jgi:hypothetical protein
MRVLGHQPKVSHATVEKLLKDIACSRCDLLRLRDQIHGAEITSPDQFFAACRSSRCLGLAGGFDDGMKTQACWLVP